MSQKRRNNPARRPTSWQQRTLHVVQRRGSNAHVQLTYVPAELNSLAAASLPFLQHADGTRYSNCHTTHKQHCLVWLRVRWSARVRDTDTVVSGLWRRLARQTHDDTRRDMEHKTVMIRFARERAASGRRCTYVCTNWCRGGNPVRDASHAWTRLRLSEPERLYDREAVLGRDSRSVRSSLALSSGP